MYHKILGKVRFLIYILCPQYSHRLYGLYRQYFAGDPIIPLEKIHAKDIDDMTQLRQGIGLQAYGQRDPLVEYKMAGFDMFDAMISAIQEDTIRLLYHVQVQQKVEREQVAKVTGTNKDESAANAPKKRASKKVFPNEPCPCESGKKYNHRNVFEINYRE